MFTVTLMCTLQHTKDLGPAGITAIRVHTLYTVVLRLWLAVFLGEFDTCVFKDSVYNFI